MKLTEGKKRAIAINQGSKTYKNKKNRKSPLDVLEEKLLYIVVVIFVVVLVIVLICSVNKPALDETIPENFNEFSHLYDNETEDMEGVKTTAEQEDVATADETPMSSKRAISCWGDSYTVSPNDTTVSYAGVLSALSNRIVYNIGTPLDSLKVIAGRQGGTPLLTTPFTIPMDKTPVEIAVDSSAGGRMEIDFTKNAGLNPVKIGGVSGLISKLNGKLYFTRDASGSQVMLLDSAEITTRGMELRRNDISVFFVGSDSSVEDPDLMCQLYKSMVDYLNDENKAYLIVGPIVGDPEQMDLVDEKLSAEFGERYFNLRNYICNEYDADYLSDYTDSEKEDITNGMIPERYFNDGEKMFLNELGAEITGTAIYEKLLELGYFKN